MNTEPRTSVGTGMTLGSIVDRHPSLARELEHRELDYCCGGGVTLGQACRDLGLDPAAVAAELSDAICDEPPAPWSAMGLSELVDHLVETHHRYLWAELPRLGALLDRVVEAHREHHPELTDIAECFAAIRNELEPHLTEEERVLFPAITELDTAPMAPSFGFGSIGRPISEVLHDHHELGGLLRRLRELSDGYRAPADACASYTALFTGFAELDSDTHLHIHKENNVLFPRVIHLEQRRMS